MQLKRAEGRVNFIVQLQNNKLLYTFILVLIIILNIASIPEVQLKQSESIDYTLGEDSIHKPTHKTKLSKKLLIEHKWQQQSPILECSIYLEFQKRGIGRSYGCGLVGDLEFQYLIKNDTLHVIQNYTVVTNATSTLKRSGKYIFTDHSLLLVQVLEWDSVGKCKIVPIPRTFEYIMR